MQGSNALEQDRLAEPVVFISSEKSISMKIPAIKLGEEPLMVDRVAVFKDHKYTTNSRYIASYLRSRCPKPGLCEFLK